MKALFIISILFFLAVNSFAQDAFPSLEIEADNQKRISGIGLEMTPGGRQDQADENVKKVSSKELVPAVEKYLRNL